MNSYYTHEDLYNNTQKQNENLFNEHFPKAGRELEKTVNKLNKLIKEIQTIFPDANYYLANDSFHILLGNNSDGDGTGANPQFSVSYEILKSSGGGDW